MRGDTLTRNILLREEWRGQDKRKTEKDVLGLDDAGGLQHVEGRAGQRDEWRHWTPAYKAAENQKKIIGLLLSEDDVMAPDGLPKSWSYSYSIITLSKFGWFQTVITFFNLKGPLVDLKMLASIRHSSNATYVGLTYSGGNHK